MIAWNPPPVNWVKLDVDGRMSKESGLIYAGGVVRDTNRQWIKGFALNRGMGSVLEAEYWGLFEGCWVEKSIG
ncbi:hypothetical protein ACOSP7_002481 [Xanthoceras sorbifolium]